MRKSILLTLQCILILICLLTSVSIVAAQKPSAANQLEGLLNTFTTLQAQFTQITQDQQHNIVQQTQGSVMLMRPGRFRWETTKPMHQIVIANGNTLWVYDVDLQQATKQIMKHNAIDPAILLSGNVNDLLQQFTVTMIPHHGVTVFQLTPKKPNPAFHSVAVAFRDDTLSSMQIYNNLNQTSIFDFTDVTLNAHLSPDLFHFTPPKNVSVLQ